MAETSGIGHQHQRQTGPASRRSDRPERGSEPSRSFSKTIMNPYIETMQQLQRRLQSGTKAGIEKLRTQVPAPVLDHFDRLIAQGRKGVAEVNHGVCGGCHLRLPAAMVVPSAEHDDLEICENCGAYLIFPTTEVEPVVRKRRRRTVALV